MSYSITIYDGQKPITQAHFDSIPETKRVPMLHSEITLSPKGYVTVSSTMFAAEVYDRTIKMLVWLGGRGYVCGVWSAELNLGTENDLLYLNTLEIK